MPQSEPVDLPSATPVLIRGQLFSAFLETRCISLAQAWLRWVDDEKRWLAEVEAERDRAVAFRLDARWPRVLRRWASKHAM